MKKFIGKTMAGKVVSVHIGNNEDLSCVEGIPEFSLLPKGTKLLFPSGAVLLVEGYNPPCAEMGLKLWQSMSHVQVSH